MQIRKKEESQRSVIMRIMTNYLQVITAVLSYNISFPNVIEDIFYPAERVGSSSEPFVAATEVRHRSQTLCSRQRRVHLVHCARCSCPREVPILQMQSSSMHSTFRGPDLGLIVGLSQIVVRNRGLQESSLKSKPKPRGRQQRTATELRRKSSGLSSLLSSFRFGI